MIQKKTTFVNCGGGSVLLWDCFSKHPEDLIKILDIMDSMTCQDILNENLGGSAEKLQLEFGRIFQQDGDLKCTSKSIQKC